MYPLYVRRALVAGAILFGLGCRRSSTSSPISADPTPRADASAAPKTSPPTVKQEKLERHGEVDVTLEWPRIDLGRGTAGEKLSNSIEADARAEADRIEKAHHDAVVDDHDAGSPFLASWQLDLTCVPSLVSHDLVAVVCEGYDFEGGAHGMPTTTMYVDEIVADAPVPLAIEPIVGTKGLAKLAAATLESLKKEGAPYALDGTLDDKKIAAEGYLRTFTLDRSGFTFVFPPYAAGPYAAGQYVVKLSWDAVAAAADDAKTVARLRAEANEPDAIEQPVEDPRDEDDGDAGP